MDIVSVHSFPAGLLLSRLSGPTVLLLFVSSLYPVAVSIDISVRHNSSHPAPIRKASRKQ